MPKSEKTEVLIEIFDAIRSGEIARARRISQHGYAWQSNPTTNRSMSKSRSLRVFFRDGFIDRYFGTRLVFPGALLLLGQLLPDCFPMHKNWQVAHSHVVYWELWPVVDHLVPITRGGSNEDSNLVTTSELHNSAKAHWTIQDLGWELEPQGDLGDWDGLVRWTQEWIESNPAFEPDQTLANWIKAARIVTA